MPFRRLFALPCLAVLALVVALHAGEPGLGATFAAGGQTDDTADGNLGGSGGRGKRDEGEQRGSGAGEGEGFHQKRRLELTLEPWTASWQPADQQVPRITLLLWSTPPWMIEVPLGWFWKWHW